MNAILRSGRPADVLAVHDLVTSNLEAGHLLPRSLEEIQEHITRFVIAEVDGRVVACAELARLSPLVAEVRSLVVDASMRGRKIGTKLVARLATSAAVAGYGTLCAFTHDPAHFVRLGFTIVPHVWLPEKIAHDCTSCVFFRRCGQYAVRLPLQPGTGVSVPERTAAMGHARGVAPRRPNIERLQLARVQGQRNGHQEEDEPVEALQA
jgi:amino-acid N-acetyltransferase